MSINVVDLKGRANRLLENALAPATRKKYGKSVKKFRDFCHALGRKGNKIFLDDSAELWLSELDKNKVTYGAILSHVSALRYHCVRHKLLDNLSTPQIKLMLRGIKKGSITSRKPVVANTSHLQRLVAVSKRVLNRREYARFAAMITLAFYGFLRPSEYCLTPSKHHIRRQDVQLSRKGSAVRLKIWTAKHSQCRSTVQVEAAEICCPVTHLKRYMSVYKTLRGPLFNVTAKSFRKTLSTMCKAAKIRSKLTPHALRHGGASWAGQKGWPDARIRAHGRWRSDAYKQYVRAY